MSSAKSGTRNAAPVTICAVLLAVTAGIPAAGTSSIFWTAPAILVGSLLIAWAAESAQFFIAQGIALALLAWIQTLPEFAVEAVLAWNQQVPLLLANLTGALRLLTGLGWPMIYCTASLFHRARSHTALQEITLAEGHAVDLMGLLAAVAYVFVVWWKASLNLFDAAVLIVIYSGYLIVLRRVPPAEEEEVEELDRIPRAIVKAPRQARIAAIASLFVVGGGLIYFMAKPFLASLLAISASLGIPTFVFVQWMAPFVSEFPEKVSAFYWARTVERASTALMNMVSSNINQWTLLAAMLPVIFSFSRGSASAIPLDSEQEIELLMTLAQSVLGMLFLLDMRLRWWEATGLFSLWVAQFALSPVHPGPGFWGSAAAHSRSVITGAYFAWAVVEIIRIATGARRPEAFRVFARMWKKPGSGGAIE